MLSEENTAFQIEETTNNQPEPEKKRRWLIWLSLSLVVFFVFVWWFFNFIKKPPVDFPINTEIVIPVGSTVEEVSALLKENNLVRSKLAFFVYFSVFSDPSALKASTYYFTTPLDLQKLAYELTQGNYGQGLLRLTHIEGESVEDLAKRVKVVLPNFSEEEFIKLAKPYEGKLFPETYMIPATYNEKELLDLLLKTFGEKTKTLQESASTSLSFDEVIILASILEREANSKESKEIVSGILQNRLAINMPLQADATIEYVLHKPLKELTPEDLKIDSPYNTYLNKGLPPTPIGNPGLEAIEAVLYPAKTDYMFYITDENGVFYYAKDFDEHRRNIAKYLR
ncbi:MAG: putative aminodeoxychorismate lyase [Parcubacteria bacterium OLB19]|nr:MAG: putative aminodeoxychorismate lyase [Parcubacteria bacterium OLB19]